MSFQKFATANTYACSFAPCSQYYNYGTSYWSSWSTSPSGQADVIGIGVNGTVNMPPIFGGIFGSEAFIECQSNWSSYSKECEKAVTARKTQVESVCEYVAYTSGASGSRTLGAIALGCVMGAAAGENLGHKQCTDTAINGILENCLG
ncbi:hypothetical protein AADZ91_11635 [Colwelliaceae bacterium 6441]